MIIPSIDIMNGRVVKLVGGKPGTSKIDLDPLEVAEKYSRFPLVSVIDLDAALGRGENKDLIKQIVKICRCMVGGGIRDIKKAYDLLEAGAAYVIIGTRADKNFLNGLPSDRIIAAVDVKKGDVTVEGWTKKSGEDVVSAMNRLEGSVAGFLCTNIDREGKKEGIDEEHVRCLRSSTNKKLIYAGGIRSLEEVSTLSALGADAVVGMAIYDGSLDPVRSISSIARGVLVPTIVQEEDGTVLMLAFSNEESLEMTMRSGDAWYYSRSRSELWEKGAISGNIQKVLRVSIDCDEDTILFTVRQTGNACHTKSPSCFGERPMTFKGFSSIVSNASGYTKELLGDPALLDAKIKEECKEVREYEDRENLVWEIGDLIYFLSVLMRSENISPDELMLNLQVKNWKKNIKPPRL